ncbi:MAG: helix-turn-helix transcriptional regulator [Nitrososphaerota archaeon]|nr:helix-turn-helix transcriptional regulator [Nitrososphaerota archaeon]
MLWKRALLVDWQKSVFELSDTRILLYLNEKKSARYSELLKSVLKNRNTLANSLRQLQKMKLVDRKVKATRPVQTEYLLTDKGRKVTLHLIEIRRTLESN